MSDIESDSIRVKPTDEGIPFSSLDEGRGTEPIEIAQNRVRLWLSENFAHNKEPYTTYVVMFSYILGNWKALVSTSLPDGRYYEVTHDHVRGFDFVDVYIKADNYTLKTNDHN